MNTVLSLDEFKQRLKGHDWFYYMSDDHRVWQSGEQDAGEILGIARSGSHEFRKAYNQHHAKHFHRECFAKPWSLPFPEDGV